MATASRCHVILPTPKILVAICNADPALWLEVTINSWKSPHDTISNLNWNANLSTSSMHG